MSVVRAESTKLNIQVLLGIGSVMPIFRPESIARA